ncbi:HlyD family secretion protein [Novosphingobium sp. MMS21-SN21R]|uniref:HlyD family secretion protein n=1 Tax=Novosphingobium sp. MMS21-SN21R TaxID=2969298 RepID=UPI002885636D|nr:HlyD family secretion protein [Novosphingobium sp. MMS21-SN21R]MDT0508532.1 HlyD family secretion protein [Novosphingobium sp. MMS21-SN21R]
MTEVRNPVDPVPVTDERLDELEEAAPEPAPAAPAGSGWQPKRENRKVLIAIVIVAVAGILAILAAWRLPPFSTAAVSTDNAFVRGRTTVISPQLSGYVMQVYVRDFDMVKAGDPLVRIDDRIFRQRVAQADAQVATQQATLANADQAARSRAASLSAQDAAMAGAEAQLLRAHADMARVNDLITDGSVSLRERDQTLAALRQAQAAVMQARAAREIARQDIRTVEVGRGGQKAGVSGASAALELSRIDLANTVIRAPEAGRLSEVGVRIGQYVTAGSQLLFLVPPETWVIANFKEAQTARIRVGQPATFTVDGLGGARLTGRVEQISPAAGSEFAVLKSDNATGNFTKVPQRIAVRIRIDKGQDLSARLRPGMSVQARVDTSGAGN